MERKCLSRGMRKYSNLLNAIFGVDDYNSMGDEEWEGCLGVACAVSVIEGVAPSLFALSRHLDISSYDIHLQHAFERLRVNGIFSRKYDINNDSALTGAGEAAYLQTGWEVERNAWCSIAGIASGYTGIREYESQDLKTVN